MVYKYFGTIPSLLGDLFDLGGKAPTVEKKSDTLGNDRFNRAKTETYSLLVATRNLIRDRQVRVCLRDGRPEEGKESHACR